MSSQVDVESLTRWNATSVSFPGECLHGMFVQTAEESSQAVVVRAGHDPASCADFKARTGSVRVVSALVLDYAPVRCAKIDLTSHTATGRLVPAGREAR